jgi:hypothetical protein
MARPASATGRYRGGPAEGNRSFLNLRRRVNCGWTPPQPTIAAQMRHKWFHNKVFAAQLRLQKGQQRQGDAELIEAVKAAGKIARGG